AADPTRAVAGPAGDPAVGFELADDRGRHRSHACRIRRRRALADESAVRARDEPEAPELVDVLAADLVRRVVSDVVVERPARVGDLELPVPPPDGPEQRPLRAGGRPRRALDD